MVSGLEIKIEMDVVSNQHGDENRGLENDDTGPRKKGREIEGQRSDLGGNLILKDGMRIKKKRARS